MTVRPMQNGDIPALEALYHGSKIQDGFKLDHERCIVVLDDQGEILAAGAVRMVPEVTILLKEGHPAAKLSWMRTLQGELLSWMNDTKHSRAIALIAPKIERSFLRRLGRFGWKEGCQSAILLTEEHHGAGEIGSQGR